MLSLYIECNLMKIYVYNTIQYNITCKVELVDKENVVNFQCLTR